MTYNPSIPQTGDNLSTSQGQMLTNFTALNTIFAFDHYTWNDSTTANQGLHKKVSFPATETVGAQSGLASVVYTKNVASVASPYFRNAIGDFVMWYGGTTSNGQASTTLANPGQLNLPNGFQLRWGTDAFVGTNGTKNVMFTPQFTTTALVAFVTLEAVIPITYVGATDLLQATFNARRSNNNPPNTPLATANFRWMAIGY